MPGDMISLHICTKNDNHMIYGSWDMEHNKTKFFVILGHFLLFNPTNNLKNENFEEIIIIIIKRLEISSFYTSVPKIMIIFHKCTKNYDHMLYCSWDVVHDRCDFYLFWTIFCPFTPLKIKILNKWKKVLRYHHFTHVYQNYDHMMYSS